MPHSAEFPHQHITFILYIVIAGGRISKMVQQGLCTIRALLVTLHYYSINSTTTNQTVKLTGGPQENDVDGFWNASGGRGRTRALVFPRWEGGAEVVDLGADTACEGFRPPCLVHTTMFRHRVVSRGGEGGRGNTLF